MYINQGEALCEGKSECDGKFYWVDGTKIDTSFLGHIKANKGDLCLRLKGDNSIDDKGCENNWPRLCQYRCEGKKHITYYCNRFNFE